MADKSLIAHLLKSPLEVRKEEEETLRQKGLERAALMQTSGAGKSLFGGIFQNFAAQQAAQVDKRTQQVVQGLGQAAGMDMRSPAERQAVQRQEQARLIQNADTLNQLRATKARLEGQNASPVLLQQINQRIEAEEARISKAASDTRAEDRAQQTLDIALSRQELEEAEFELEQAKAQAEIAIGKTMGEFDFSSSEGVDEAVSYLFGINKPSEAIRLRNAYNKNTSEMQTSIQYFADNFTNGDLTQAYDLYTQAKREGTGTKLAYKGLEDSYNEARAKRRSLQTSYTAIDVLNSGRVNIGSFAKTRQGAEKLYQGVLNSMGIGVDDDQAVARTELLMSQTNKLAGELLSSGMFGTGTGISERDLITAQEIAGASQTLTPEGMEFILRLNAKMIENQLKGYNSRLDRYNDNFWRNSPIDKENYRINIPEPSVKKYDIGKATSKAKGPSGDTIYLVEGQWVNQNGIPLERKK